MKRNLAGLIVTADFVDYRGYSIKSDAGKVTIGRMGHPAFRSYTIRSIAQAQALIDVWEDATPELRRNAAIFEKMATALQTAA